MLLKRPEHRSVLPFKLRFDANGDVTGPAVTSPAGEVGHVGDVRREIKSECRSRSAVKFAIMHLMADPNGRGRQKGPLCTPVQKPRWCSARKITLLCNLYLILLR